MTNAPDVFLAMTPPCPLGKGDVECLVCSDEDFETAMVISTKLLLNAADAYNQIGGKGPIGGA